MSTMPTLESLAPSRVTQVLLPLVENDCASLDISSREMRCSNMSQVKQTYLYKRVLEDKQDISKRKRVKALMTRNSQTKKNKKDNVNC